jgi:hypothetical protein
MCEFIPGKPGCDNRFAHELRTAGLRVENPASAIIASHLHASGVRNYVHGPDTVHGAYAAVVPALNITWIDATFRSSCSASAQEVSEPLN